MYNYRLFESDFANTKRSQSSSAVRQSQSPYNVFLPIAQYVVAYFLMMRLYPNEEYTFYTALYKNVPYLFDKSAYEYVGYQSTVAFCICEFLMVL